MIWHVVRLKTWTGDISEYVGTYANKGHALARLKGLWRRQMAHERYALRKG